MRVLMIAPEPYYVDRGTPIAVDLLADALCRRGDTVDVLTTHLGEDRVREGMRVLRVKPPFAPGQIGPGFSLAKVYCDFFILIRALRLARRGNYDVVHAVEEGSFMAWLANLLGGPPYVVDIDSSMAGQIVGRFRWLGPLAPFLGWLESLPVRRALAAVPVCESLAVWARRYCPGETIILPDVSLRSAASAPAQNLRQDHGIEGPVVMYIGNLEGYQGIDLLLESFRMLEKRGSDAELVVIGGSEAHIRKYRTIWERMSGSGRVHLLGPRPLTALAGYMDQADVLVSPRTEGINTPMKVYSYLDSGKPVVATRLPTHTQVMTDRVAVLADPEPQAFAGGIQEVLEHPDRARKLAKRAREFIALNHSPEAFHAKVVDIYGHLENTLEGA